MANEGQLKPDVDGNARLGSDCVWLLRSCVELKGEEDVYEKLLRYPGNFESEEHLKAWLLRVTINRCHDLTRASYQKDTELDETIPAPAQADGSVLDAVRALPDNYRDAIYLHYYEGYTAAEIGRLLGAPANTVLSWLRRGRGLLHTMLKEEIEDEVV